MLEVQGLHAGYGLVEVLHGLTFQVPKGQVVTLIGSNGAGKTTTMRALSGMIRPRSGTIRLNGKDIAGLESHDVAREGLAGVGVMDEGLQLFRSRLQALVLEGGVGGVDVGAGKLLKTPGVVAVGVGDGDPVQRDVRACG